GNSVRGDIAPTLSTYRIRVRESDKGMGKDQAQRFKDLVKLTKRDARGACAGWSALAGEVPDNPSITFNLGLCAEQAGNYEKALELYHAASRVG
ncbi:tetratricopeptide repeat protein, partial [Escherichia coli]|uniref:tetratricopeptide repeat protein n=4 Tax=Bacteria TaxID=2 RepID=UPI001809288C